MESISEQLGESAKNVVIHGPIDTTPWVEIELSNDHGSMDAVELTDWERADIALALAAEQEDDMAAGARGYLLSNGIDLESGDCDIDADTVLELSNPMGDQMYEDYDPRQRHDLDGFGSVADMTETNPETMDSLLPSGGIAGDPFLRRVAQENPHHRSGGLSWRAYSAAPTDDLQAWMDANQTGFVHGDTDVGRRYGSGHHVFDRYGNDLTDMANVRDSTLGADEGNTLYLGDRELSRKALGR